MKKGSGVLLTAAVIWALVMPAGAQVVADHNAVVMFDSIPVQWIDSVKTMLLILPGESHGRGYHYGMDLLEAEDAAFASNVTWSGAPESYTASYLRTSRSYRYGASWSNSCGEEEYWTNATGTGNIETGLTYTRTNYAGTVVMGFGWCWDMTWHDWRGWVSIINGEDPVYGCHWDGCTVDGPDGITRWGLDAEDSLLTGNRVCMQTYLDAVEGYNTHEAGVVSVFTTGPVDGNHGTENGYQRWLKHEYIRSHVAAHGGYLFDYADILCWEDGVQYMDSWDGHDFQNGDPDLATGGTGYDGGDGGCHISEAGCLALGKAMWWMLARIAGWDGTADGTAPDTVTATPVISPDGGTYEEEVAVTMSCADAGAAIYYTTDGTVPDSTDTEYTGAFTLTADATVQAVAYAGGKHPSAVETAVFVITQDTVPPALRNAYALDDASVMAVFDCVLDSASAVNTGNYSIDNGIGVTGAVLQAGGTSVLLTVMPAVQEGVTYTLTATGIEDANGNASGGTQASFSFAGCALHFPFDEGSGDTAYDASGNGNHGAVGTAVWTAEGIRGGALVFDGDDTVYAGTDGFGMDTTGEFSVSVWFRVSGSFSGDLVRRGQYVFPFLLYSGGSNVRSCVRTSGTNYLTGDSVVNADVWHHAVLTYTDGARVMYMNGAQDNADVVSGAPDLGSSQSLRIGAGFSGAIDEVKIYNRALSAAEVKDLYDNAVPVELTSFTAVRLGADVELAWATASEQANLGFNVFRSVDVGPFEKINPSLIPGGGTTPAPQQYRYTDAALPAGAAAAAYYLEQVDSNMSKSYSGTVTVALQTTGTDIPAVPPRNITNPHHLPRSGAVTVDLASRGLAGQAVTVILYRPDGTVLHRERFAAAPAVFLWEGEGRNGPAAGSGVVLYQLRSAGPVLTGRTVLMR